MYKDLQGLMFDCYNTFHWHNKIDLLGESIYYLYFNHFIKS